MIYCVDPYADEPIMLINQEIGYDSQTGQGIDCALFQTELLQIDTMGKKRIQVWINSPGGRVMEGYSIYNAILKSKTPVDTYCVGACASMAGVIFQAGRKRIMSDYGWLMYHNPFDASGNGVDKDLLETIKNSCVTMVAKRCGMSSEDVAKMMDRETFILADEAFKMNLCDEIDSSVEANTKYLRKNSDVSAFVKECNLIINSILPTKKVKNSSMTKITMKLGLNDAATEDNVVTAIKGIEDRAYKAETEVIAKDNEIASIKAAAKVEQDRLTSELATVKTTLTAKEAELATVKAKADTLETEKATAQAAAIEIKARTMVEGFAKAGRIKNEATVVEPWVKLAIADFDGTKAMIEAIPLNKSAVVIPEETKLKEGEHPTSAVSLTVKNRLKRMGKLA